MRPTKLFVACIAAFLLMGTLAFGSGLRNADSGHRDSATISFGAWMTTPPTDRFPNLSPRPANHHALFPNEVKFHCGGTVNFIIAGFHQVLVYDDGKRPNQINTNLTVPTTVLPGPPLIADPNGRVYRGLDPSLQSRDRVEVVHFERPGTYLVICGVLPHFNGGMIGYVTVKDCDHADH